MFRLVYFKANMLRKGDYSQAKGSNSFDYQGINQTLPNPPWAYCHGNLLRGHTLVRVSSFSAPTVPVTCTFAWC